MGRLNVHVLLKLHARPGTISAETPLFENEK